MRDQNTAYINNMLYLPKTKIRKQGITGALDFTTFGVNKQTIQLWSEDEFHIVVPRYFISPEQLAKYSFQVIDERTKPEYLKISFKTQIWPKQTDAAIALNEAKNGILNLGTGKGKTVLALSKISYEETPGLIIVPNTYLKNQWIEEALIHLDITRDDIGIIQGSSFDWKKPICIAMIDTLADRVVQGRIPDEMRDWFGVTIYDEVHHVGAKHFSNVAAINNWCRIGLSATPTRTDGLDCIYRYHIGPIIFCDLSFDLSPEIEFVETPIEIDMKGKDVVDRYHKELNIPKLIAAVGKLPASLEFRSNYITKHLTDSRKCICLGQSKDQLKLLHKLFEDQGYKSCLIIRETDPEERSKLVRESQVAFIIGSLGLEGLNDVNLESLFFLSPIGGDKKWGPNGVEYLGNRLLQGLGRLLRDPVLQGLPAKKPPKVVFFDDIKIPPLHSLTNQARRFLDQQKLNYTITKY